MVRQGEIADFLPRDVDCRLLLDQRRRAGRRRLQNDLSAPIDERLVEAALDFRSTHLEGCLISFCRSSACAARQYYVPPRLMKLRLEALINRVERGRNIVAAKEFRNCAHRLMSEDAPRRSLYEGIEIVPK